MRYKAMKINGIKYDAHRVIAGAIGLGPDMVVHHKDGNKLNNDPCNLEIITAKEHLAKHGFGTIIRPAPIFAPDKDLTAICRVCGERKGWDLFPKNKSWSHGRTSKCKECTGKYKRAWYKSKIEHAKQGVLQWAEGR